MLIHIKKTVLKIALAHLFKYLCTLTKLHYEWNYTFWQIGLFNLTCLCSYSLLLSSFHVHHCCAATSQCFLKVNIFHIIFSPSKLMPRRILSVSFQRYIYYVFSFLVGDNYLFSFLLTSNSFYHLFLKHPSYVLYLGADAADEWNRRKMILAHAEERKLLLPEEGTVL